MLFKRRHKAPTFERIRQWVWPKGGPQRGLKYVWYRIARLPDTPHRIAAGVACGMAVSFTPFLGFHLILAALLSLIVRGNIAASLIGTFVGNPWTFPFFFALAAESGYLLLGHETGSDVPAWSWASLWESPFEYLAAYWPALKPLAIGSLPIVLIVWLLSYIALKGLIGGYRSKRAGKLRARLRSVIGSEQ